MLVSCMSLMLGPERVYGDTLTGASVVKYRTGDYVSG
jgi:hypothetical protein